VQTPHIAEHYLVFLFIDYEAGSEIAPKAQTGKVRGAIWGLGKPPNK
jgi:hypothetical protein